MIEKQQLCKKLERELHGLRATLSCLLRQKEGAQETFDAELQRLRTRKEELEAQHIWDIPMVTVARNKYSRMSVDKSSSSEGRALQEASRHINCMRGNILGVENRLEVAKIPPPALYQPLPDSRGDDYGAFAVLFYSRSDLAGCLPLLQQFCCAAQLCVCPWPLAQPPLWDVEETISPDALKKHRETWNSCFVRASKDCHCQPYSPEVASVDKSRDVHIVAVHKPPREAEVRSSLRVVCVRLSGGFPCTYLCSCKEQRVCVPLQYHFLWR